ncbi:MAG: family 1 glycosylhydrolase [Candidatus Obscuribacterales bacterium]
MTDRRFLKFPDGFLWGAATSHFQIEGHPHEMSNRSSDWSEWTTLDGKISDATTADRACDFYNRYSDDIEICRKLNLNAFRLSLNWPALCPEPPQDGKPYTLNAESVAYYRGLLSGLKKEGITTFVTLFHFTLPRWLSDAGGWTSPLSITEFERFAALAAEAFGDLVDYWITLNEPLAYAYQSFVTGAWPPGFRNDYLKAFQCIRYMLEAHGKAYAALHKQTPGKPVSFTMHWRPFTPKHRWNPLDHMVRYYRDYVFNLMFPMAVQTGSLEFPYPLSSNAEVKKISGEIPGLKGAMDWIAVNYYTRELSEFTYKWPIDIFGTASSEYELEVNCMGWEHYPDGLYKTLIYDLSPFKYNSNGTLRPIVITENGFATAFAHDLDEGDWSLADDQRINYLTTHLSALHNAIEDGANVKGYMYWSLLDNFEWAEGLRPRFGLVRVTYSTQERTFRHSASVYAEIAKHNGLHE